MAKQSLIKRLTNRKANNKGALVEQRSCEYLQQHGLKLIQRNYLCRGGEIDLIMRDNKQLVFVEVRYRSRPEFGSAAESVNRSKQQKLLHSAEYFLQRQPQLKPLPCRFDVIAVTGELKNLQFEWIKNAFTQ